jgi:hypothetical protein
MGEVIGRIAPARHEPTFVLGEATYHIENEEVPRPSTVIVIAATPTDEDGMRSLYVWTGGSEADEASVLDTLWAASRLDGSALEREPYDEDYW